MAAVAAKANWKKKKGVARNAESGVDVRQVTEEKPLLAENAVACAKHQAKADRPEAYRADCEVKDILHQNVDHVAGTNQTRLQQAEACLHKEDKETCDQHPDSVQITDDAPQVFRGGHFDLHHFFRGSLFSCCIILCEDHAGQQAADGPGEDEQEKKLEPDSPIVHS